MEPNSLLAGVRILDLSRLLPGPFCTLYLAQLGAEVIKIEDPDGGDYCRSVSPDLFALVNRGKKSVTLDLRDSRDVELFCRLAETADMIIESFRPGVMDRLGCGYNDLKAINPRLVYAALTGYGQTGPYRARPGHDINYRAYAGELFLAAQPGAPPIARAFPIADLAGGALTCAIGALAALLGARETGNGTFVDIGMMDGLLAMQVVELAKIREHGLLRASESNGDSLFGPMPSYGAFQCADGKFIALGAMERKFFVTFCRLAGRPDLLDRALWDSRDGLDLKNELSSLFLTRSRDHWDAMLAGSDTCVSAILTFDEVLQDPQVKARAMIEWIDSKPVFALPMKFDNAVVCEGHRHSPELGEDNVAILGALSP